MSAKLFRNATIITFDESSEAIVILREHDLFVEDDTITEIGKDLQAPGDAEVIDATNQILSPGFIDTHTHLWQTALRTSAPNTTLGEYFGSYSPLSPIIKSFSSEDVYISTLAGLYESLNGGTTSFLEHAHNDWDLEVVKRGYDAGVESGARLWWCAAADDEILEGRAKHRRSNDGGDLMTMGLAWDGLERQSAEEVARKKEIIKTLDLQAITLHDLGGPWPVAHNGPAMAADKQLQDLELPVVFSHAGFATPDDIAALREHNWYLSITPKSELHYGHGQQTSRFVQDQASLGVDTSFTFSGDLLTQARMWLQTVRGTSYNRALETGRIPKENPMKVEDAFLLATRQGARALRRDDLGVLKVGAKADIVVFDGESPIMAGWTDPLAAVILHANVGDIKHVMIGGQWRKRDGELVLKDGDWSSFQQRFARMARRLQAENAGPQPLGEKFLGMREWTEVEVMSTRR